MYKYLVYLVRSLLDQHGTKGRSKSIWLIPIAMSLFSFWSKRYPALHPASIFLSAPSRDDAKTLSKESLRMGTGASLFLIFQARASISFFTVTAQC
jgi:hypothetical protein